MKNLEIYLSSEQPTTCPKCGIRTEIIEDLQNSQHHKCLSENCFFEFILEFDEEEI